MSVALQRGRYFAGINRPFFIPQSAVRSALEGYGATKVRFFDRDEYKPPVNPKSDAAYDDDWDEWISADYEGKPKVLDVSRKWSWLIFVPEKRKKKVKPPKKKPSGKPGLPTVNKDQVAWVLIGLSIDLALWNLARSGLRKWKRG